MFFTDPSVIRLSIGYGQNNFTMSHGSFSYDEEFTYRKELRFAGTAADPESAGMLLIYEDPSVPVEYLLRLSEEDGNTVLRYEGARGKKDAEILVKPLLPNRFFITIPSDPSSISTAEGKLIPNGT